MIAGHDRDYVTALISPECGSLRRVVAARAFFAGTGGSRTQNPEVRTEFRAFLESLASGSTGLSTRIEQAVLSGYAAVVMDTHELTDKGSISQRAVLENRAVMVEELYSNPPSLRVVLIEKGSSQQA